MIALILLGTLASATPAPIAPKTVIATSQTQAALQAQIIKAAGDDMVHRVGVLANTIDTNKASCNQMAAALQAYDLQNVSALQSDGAVFDALSPDAKAAAEKPIKPVLAQDVREMAPGLAVCGTDRGVQTAMQALSAYTGP